MNPSLPDCQTTADLSKVPLLLLSPICLSSPPLLYLFPPFFSSHPTPSLPVKVQLLGKSGELCLCVYKGEKKREREKGSNWSRKKEKWWEGKTLCLGLMKYRRYIDRFCGAKSFFCPSLRLLPFFSPSLHSSIAICPSLWLPNKRQALFGTKVFLKLSLAKTNRHSRAQDTSISTMSVCSCISIHMGTKHSSWKIFSSAATFKVLNLWLGPLMVETSLLRSDWMLG